jgi:hypothetical protein
MLRAEWPRAVFSCYCFAAAISVLHSSVAHGQTYKVLGTFNLSNGAHPRGDLLLSGTTVYGMTCGADANGTYNNIFSINTDGTNFRTVLPFNGSTGAYPEGGLTLTGATLYGMTRYGGSGNGNVFSIQTDGTGFTNLHLFDGTTGAQPEGDVIVNGSKLYGTTSGVYNTSNHGITPA